MLSRRTSNKNKKAKRDCDNEGKYEDFADSATTKSAQSVGLDIYSIPILVIEHVTATYKVEYRASNCYAHVIDGHSGYYNNNPVEDKRLIIVAIMTEVEIIDITVTYGKLPICENNAFGKPASPFEQTGVSKIYHFKLRPSNFIEVNNTETNYLTL